MSKKRWLSSHAGSQITGFLVGLWFPVGVVMLVLRGMRASSVWTSYAKEKHNLFLWGMDVFKSDVLFFLSCAALLIGLGTVIKSPTKRLVAFLTLQFIGIVSFLIELVSHHFFRTTGTGLDYYLLSYTLASGDATWELVIKSTPVYYMVSMGIGFIVAWTLPWLLAFLLRKFLSSKKEQTPVEGEDETSQEKPVEEPLVLKPRRWLLVAGVVLFALAFIPGFVERNRLFVKNAPLNILQTFAQAMLQEEAKSSRDFVDTQKAVLKEKVSVQKHPNVVVILLESTRARSVGLYNEKLKTTPFLDELGKTSAVAERAYTVIPHTSKAIMASMCGIEPNLTISITEALHDGIPGNCMGKLFKGVGYNTAFFQSATRNFEARSRLVANIGFDTFKSQENFDLKGFEKANYFGREDFVMLKPSEDWVAKNKNKPIFLTYLTNTPHHNYLAPRKRFGRHPFDTENKELNLYLNSVHYVDHFTKHVFEMFKRHGLYENTIFIILGDHGEGFGEHGRFQHDNVIYEEGLRIPFIVHDARNKKPKRIKHAVNQLDILPTAVDLAGFDIKQATYPGTNVLELEKDRIMFAHCWYERRCMASILKDDKYIHHFDKQPDEYFDISKDPFEKEDLIGSAPEHVKRLRGELLAWRASVNSMYAKHNKDKLGKSVMDKRPKNIQNKLDVKFGQNIALIGYNISPKTPVKPGKRARVTLFFEVLKPPGDDWRLFVHGEGGMRRKNHDHIPVRRMHPIEKWKKGQFIADTFDYYVPVKIRKNVRHYDLQLGFWKKAKPKDLRLPATGSGVLIRKDRVRAVRIPLAAPTSPKPPVKKPVEKGKKEPVKKVPSDSVEEKKKQPPKKPSPKKPSPKKK